MVFRWPVFLIFVFLMPMTGQSEILNRAGDQLSDKELVLQEKARKRLYPGGRDEEDLIVHPQAIIARRKLNRREVEKEVYKQLFNEELKGDAESSAEEEAAAADDE